MPNLSLVRSALSTTQEEAPAMSGAPTDRGFYRRERGMDQGTTPKASMIGLLGKKKKPGEVNDTGLQGSSLK